MAKLLLKQASGLVRSALQPAITAWMIVLTGTNGGIGALGVGALGISIVVLTASPGNARCLVAGQIRDHISDIDRPEAQHTGCIRSQLSPAKYLECLAAQPTCLLGDRRRTTCPETTASKLNEPAASARSCRRRLQRCLEAQPQ
jgi:hypothetical protein